MTALSRHGGDEPSLDRRPVPRWPRRLWARAWREVSRHPLEISALALGIALRFVMWDTFSPTSGYDFDDHWRHLDWFRANFAIPKGNYTRTTYHAPLYHFLAGMLGRLGPGPNGIQGFSVALACARLVTLAYGLRLALPASPLARQVALAAAAILPCSVHLDVMLTQEPLSNFLTTLFLVFALVLQRAPDSKRLRWAIATGGVAGLALLTKVSALAVVAVLIAAGPFEAIVGQPRSLELRTRRLASWGAALLVMFAVGGWWYVRTTLLYGKPFVSTWDFLPTPDTVAANAGVTPALDRRTLGYVVGWSTDIYKSPHWPNGLGAHPRFWPTALASTFADYYHYGFERGVHKVMFARASAMAGTLIAAVTAIAWLFLAVYLVRKRDAARAILLALPPLGFLGQMWFSIQHPYDWEGPIKGEYMHFSMAPLYAVLGLAVAWLWARPAGRPFAVLTLLALAVVASYTFYCRLVA